MQSKKIFRAYRHVDSALPIFNCRSSRHMRSALSGDGHIGNFKLPRCLQLVDFDVCDNQNVMSKW